MYTTTGLSHQRNLKATFNDHRLSFDKHDVYNINTSILFAFGIKNNVIYSYKQIVDTVENVYNIY